MVPKTEVNEGQSWLQISKTYGFEMMVLLLILITVVVAQRYTVVQAVELYSIELCWVVEEERKEDVQQ